MKKKIIIIVSIILVIGLAIGLFLILGNKKTKGNNGPKASKVEVTFDANGGNLISMDGGGAILIDGVDENGKVSKPEPNPVKDGYNFVGWYTEDGKEFDFNTKVTANLKLIAKWEEIPKDAKTFVITFDSKGGSTVSKLTVECDKELTLPKNPTKTGYKFVSWADKHGKVILNGAKLACEDLTLYANWEKVEEKKTETKKDTTTTTPTKTYTCPSGYTLSGTKCTIQGTVKEKCPSGTTADGSLCIKTSDHNEGTRKCKVDTVSIDGKGHTWTGEGDYYYIQNAYGKCAYYNWTSYTSKTQCDNAKDIYHNTTWVSELGRCYAATKIGNYETVCSSNYQYYTSAELSSKFGIHNDGACYRKVSKEKYCDSDYTLTNGKCVKTIDATAK